MSAFYVVYEYNDPQKGTYGSRFSVPYANKSAFQTATIQPNVIVIAEDLRQDQAVHLTSLTPEICTLMAAIENTKFSNLAEDFYLVKSAMVTAHRQILKNRDIIKTNCLLLSDASKYINAFKRMTVGAPLSLKVASQLSALKLLRNDQGQIKDYRPFVAYQ